jgi:hypothetical protein
MEHINISLCIPTMNRFDTFLEKYLKTYFEFLKSGIISEIIICDENGYDYEKIMNIYGEYINNNDNFKLYKNDVILGVFKNKLKVASLASSEYIALIDSDNFCDKDYFLTVKKYIITNQNSFSESVILSPSFAKPNFNFKNVENMIITKQNIANIVANHYYDYFILLNTGNFVISKNIIINMTYDESMLFNTTACDVLYFNLLAFQQFNDCQIHVVKDLEYTHVVHDGSIYMNTVHNCEHHRDNIIMPSYLKLK